MKLNPIFAINPDEIESDTQALCIINHRLDRVVSISKIGQRWSIYIMSAQGYPHRTQIDTSKEPRSFAQALKDAIRQVQSVERREAA